MVAVHVKPKIGFSRKLFVAVRADVGLFAVDFGNVSHERVVTAVNGLATLTAADSSLLAWSSAPGGHDARLVGTGFGRIGLLRVTGFLIL